MTDTADEAAYLVAQAMRAHATHTCAHAHAPVQDEAADVAARLLAMTPASDGALSTLAGAALCSALAGACQARVQGALLFSHPAATSDVALHALEQYGHILLTVAPPLSGAVAGTHSSNGAAHAHNAKLTCLKVSSDSLSRLPRVLGDCTALAQMPALSKVRCVVEELMYRQSPVQAAALVVSAVSSLLSLPMGLSAQQRTRSLTQALQQCMPRRVLRNLYAAGVHLKRASEEHCMSSEAVAQGPLLLLGDLVPSSTEHLGCLLIATTSETYALDALRVGPGPSWLSGMAALAAGVTVCAPAVHWRALSATLVCIAADDLEQCGAVVRAVTGVAIEAWSQHVSNASSVDTAHAVHLGGSCTSLLTDTESLAPLLALAVRCPHHGRAASVRPIVYAMRLRICSRHSCCQRLNHEPRRTRCVHSAQRRCAAVVQFLGNAIARTAAAQSSTPSSMEHADDSEGALPCVCGQAVLEAASDVLVRTLAAPALPGESALRRSFGLHLAIALHAVRALPPACLVALTCSGSGEGALCDTRAASPEFGVLLVRSPRRVLCHPRACWCAARRTNPCLDRRGGVAGGATWRATRCGRRRAARERRYCVQHARVSAARAGWAGGAGRRV